MTATMQALVLHGIGDIRLEALSIPMPGPGQALVRVAWCGVCGSDIPRIYSTGAHRHPIVPGHEMSGVVEAVGPDVAGIEPGARVVVFPLIWCGACASCEVGRYAQCANYDYLGSRRDGGLAEYVVAPIANLVPVPDGLALDVAALCEPAAVALHALRRCGLSPIGGAVAIFGAGPIGILVAQWSRIMGAARIMVFDPVEWRREFARSRGFGDAFDPTARRPREVVAEMTGGQGAMICVEAAGAPPTLIEACECVAAHGAVVLLGNPSGDGAIPRATWSRVLRQEASLVGVWNSAYAAHGAGDDWRAALDAMAKGALNAAALITSRAPLAAGIGALEAIRDGRGAQMKVLIGEGETAWRRSRRGLPSKLAEEDGA